MTQHKKTLYIIIALQTLFCSLAIYGMDEKKTNNTDNNNNNIKQCTQKPKSEMILAEEKASETFIDELKTLHKHKRVSSYSVSRVTLPYQGDYPLHYAITQTTTQPETLIKLCSEHDPFKQDQYGRTALHYAALYNGTDVIKYILSKEYLASYASTYKKIVTIPYIRDIINLKDENGCTAINYAFYLKDWATVEILSAYVKNFMQSKNYSPVEQEIKSFIGTLQKPQPPIIPTTVVSQPIIVQNNYMITTVPQPTPRQNEDNWLKRLFCSCSCHCGSGQSS